MTLLELPLGIDLHAHFREPGGEYKETLETGYQAALAGGIGTVLDMPNTNPPIDTVENLVLKRKLLKEYPYIHQIVGITNKNVETKELEKLASEARIYKIFMANSTGKLAISYENMIKALETLRSSSPYIFVHAEKPNLIQSRKIGMDEKIARPPEAEVEAIEKVIDLNDEFPNINFHITHVSTIKGAELLVKEGNKLNWDVLPKHLSFNSDLIRELGNLAIMNPPLRSEQDREGLYQLLLDGKIPFLTSDHAPHTKEDKNNLVAGAPGIQVLYYFLIDLLVRGELSQQTVTELIYSHPKMILDQYNLRYREGKLIVDTEQVYNISKEGIKSKSKWSLWEKYQFQGKIDRIIFEE